MRDRWVQYTNCIYTIRSAWLCVYIYITVVVEGVLFQNREQYLKTISQR